MADPEHRGEQEIENTRNNTYCSQERPITPQCFASPAGCNNCFRKDRYGTMFDKTKRQYDRCGACHIVAYCDEICQLEHWKKIHHKHCNRLNGTKMVRKHNKQTCELCTKMVQNPKAKYESSYHPETICHIPQLQRAMQVFLGSSFGYHNGDARCKSKRTYTGQLPFTLGEVSGIFREQVYGRALAHAIRLIFAIARKIDKKDGRSLLLGAKLYSTLVNMRTRLWTEELTIGNPTDTIIIVTPGFNLFELQELMEQLCYTRTLQVWGEAARLSFYLMNKVEHLMRPLEMKIEALKGQEGHVVKQQAICCKETMLKLNKQQQFSWLIWPCRKGNRLTLELTSFDIVQLENVDTWKPTKETKKVIKEFFGKGRTCQNCLKCSPQTHRCTRCKSAQYCTKSCQEKDFKAHEDSCLLWKEAKARKIPGRSEQQRRQESISELAYEMKISM